MKTSNGKYVAPQLVEGTIGKDRFIEQIAIVADARHFVSALIVPCFESLEEYARSINLQYQCKTELLRHPRWWSSSRHAFRICKGAGQVRAGEEVHPAAERLLHGAGRTDPTMKLRRKIIESKYQRGSRPCITMSEYNHV